jgi:tRNA threonylcarbamoyladenosine biosynthesis protein TsaE
MEWEVITSSAEETQELGRLIGSLVVRSANVFLYGELGTGKTCLTRGIGQSLADDEEVYVSSPSYTLMNLYPGRLNLYHFDLYRLSGMDDLIDIGFEDYLREDGVIVVEWADRAEDMKEDGLFIRFQHLNESRRKLIFSARGEEHEELLRQLSGLWPEGRSVRD